MRIINYIKEMEIMSNYTMVHTDEYGAEINITLNGEDADIYHTRTICSECSSKKE